MATATDIVIFDNADVYQTFLANMAASPKYAGLVHYFQQSEDARQNTLREIAKADQIYENDNGFFVYRIPDPFYAGLQKSFLFQEDRWFLEEWYNQCDQYVNSLDSRESYILSRYTRHGDEVVNKLLRDPAGFSSNTRIQQLMQESMTNENLLLHAMQLIDIYDPENHNSYLQSDGSLMPSELYEVLKFEKEYMGDIDYENPVEVLDNLKPLIYRYIEDLHQILRNAPPLPAPLQVFRGSETDYLNNPLHSAVVDGFISTTLDSCVGEYYPRNNYIYQMIIHPGTPCLSIKNASKYYAEFEILVDTGCAAMSSGLVQKHTLQTDINSGDVDPYHVFSEARNIIHKVRHIQVRGNTGGTVGSVGSVGSTANSTKSKKSKGSTGSKKSKGAKGSKGGYQQQTKMTRRRQASKIRSTTSTSTKRHSRKKPTSPTRSLRKMKQTWMQRDLADPKATYGDGRVPKRIHEKLLAAHKQMGTNFH